MKKLSPAQERALVKIRSYHSSNPFLGWVTPYLLGERESTLNVLLHYGLVEWQYCPDGSGMIEWRAKGD